MAPRLSYAVRVEAVCWLIVRRLWTRSARMQSLLRPPAGRRTISLQERRLALRVEAAFRRRGVSCLWRSIVVTEMLRRRGVPAFVLLSAHRDDPRDAHAVVQVGDSVLGDEDLADSAIFR